jgi:hypothetical protein
MSAITDEVPMSMPSYDWIKLYEGDPMLMPLRLTVGVLGIALLALVLGLR